MGVYEDIVGRSSPGWMPNNGVFPPLPAPPPVVDDATQAAMAREADEAATRRFARQKRNPNVSPVPDAQSAGVQLAMNDAPPGTGVPFSTQAGMLPPITIQPPPDPNAEPNPTPQADGAVPLPRPRPETAPTDTSAASRGGHAVEAPGQPTPLLPPEASAAPPVTSPTQLPSILDRLRTSLGDNSNTLLAIGAGFAGAPNWGQAISRAASAAIPARAADVKQRLAQQGQTYGYQAMIDAGVPAHLAAAALTNPEIMKSVSANYLGDRKGQLVDVGFDRYGNPIKGIFDPYTKKITRPIFDNGDQASAAGGGASAVDAGIPRVAAGAGTRPSGSVPLPGDTYESTDVSSQSRKKPAIGTETATEGAVTPENDITGPDYLEKLKESDPMYAREVEARVNGDAPMPTGRQAQTAFGKRLRQDVLTVEPGLSDADYSTRLATRKAYTSGNESKVTRSVNTALHHGAILEKAINDLNNFDTMPAVMNRGRELVKGQLSPDYQRKLAAYNTAVANFGKELDFAVSGGRPTVSGTKHQMEGFDPAASHATQLEKLKTAIEFLNGRLISHTEGYNRGMKRNVEPIDFVEPVNRKFYYHITGEEPPGEAGATTKETAPATAAPATAAPLEPTATGPNGEKVVWRGGKWQPVTK